MEKDKVKDATALELTDAILEYDPYDKSMICFRLALGYMTPSYIDSVITGTHNYEYAPEEDKPQGHEPELGM